MQRDFAQRKTKQRGQPSRIYGTGWQALDGDVTHGPTGVKAMPVSIA